MIRPDLDRWNQSVPDLALLAVQADHPRTRERFLALFQIASGFFNATQWAAAIGRCHESVMAWVHLDNQQGPRALIFRHTGGRAPFLRLPINRR
jgi:hypothetical protein